MKKLFSSLLVLIILSTALPFQIHSAEINDSIDEIIYLDDGSYITIELNVVQSRTSFATTGEKKYTYYNSQDVADWSATLSGLFTYNGTTATCKTSTRNVTIINDGWHEDSKVTSKSGASAIADLTMLYKVLGITLNNETIRMTLTCDKDGNLS